MPGSGGPGDCREAMQLGEQGVQLELGCHRRAPFWETHCDAGTEGSPHRWRGGCVSAEVCLGSAHVTDNTRAPLLSEGQQWLLGYGPLTLQPWPHFELELRSRNLGQGLSASHRG